ncbi:MAG TPA: glycosyltransferase family 2 protein [Acidimicrobiales bacterium]|jgi:GT2 family glycosyltransferase|nr:glycosyltransferase family 2 protein [Acidimicrobiales bacterium]
MDSQVPAVVAVVVTTGPGPWFDEALASLAAQEYEELSVLVLATGDGPDPSDRVGRMLPDAFVRLLPGRVGYAAAANEALGMVEGAAFFLLCHDDCALDPDVVHNMVEESFRSNAGVVSPKFVNWDDPSILLHVGMSCDKTGAVVDRIQDGEVDHGQHDAVRDVFVAPGGCILIRADLWRELGGFDVGIVAMGEDLDLSWRSQVAGSRVVVAPDARVRHREVVASGILPLSVMVPDDGAHPVTMQALQRRHELRTVLKCYGWFHLIRVLPQAALLALGEVVVALAARDRQRARAVAGAWWWNLRHLAELRQLRHQLAAHRLFPDTEVRRLQLRGSARLSRYLSRLSHQGFDAANAVAISHGASPRDSAEPEVAVLTGSVGLAFSEDSDFDDLDDLGHRSGRDRFGRQVRRPPLTTGRQRVVAMVVAAVVIAVGCRELFFGSLPLLGQLAPSMGWTADWHHFFAGWQAAGVGTTAPASPAFGIMGVAGTVLLGAMGLAQKVLLLGCIPLGAIGLSRFMRPLVSPRARVVATICYLGLPLPYGALGTGRWDGLVAYAAFPFIVTRLARLAGLAPFDPVVSRGWRSTASGQIAVLGAIIAAATSFAPAVLPMTLVSAFALVFGSALTGKTEHAGAVVSATVKAVAVALLLSAPWVVGTALAGSHSVDIFGLPVSSAAAPSWGQLIRFAIGPTARSPIVWLLVAASALPLLLGSGTRLTWAARLWVLACASWVLAYAGTHGWMGSFAPSETVVLAPAALAVAAGIGLGISSFENDLAGRSFGWRQVVSVTALVAVVVGLLPVAGGALSGRWGMPANGVEQPLSFLNKPSVTNGYRVLWLGDPRALPAGGWSVEPGLSYALTGQGLPSSADVWTPAGPGPADIVSSAVRLAVTGGTVHLGRLLAAQSVRYVVVVEGLAPSQSAPDPAIAFAPPTGMQRALLNQDDLQIVPGEFGIQVYKNNEAMPIVAERAQTLPASSALSYPGAADVVRWQPILAALSSRHATAGPIGAGTVYDGNAPAGSFSLSVRGQAVARRPAFGWAAQYPNAPAGPASLTFQGAPFVPLGVLIVFLGWIVLAAAVLGWRRWPLHRLAQPEPAPEGDMAMVDQ